MFKKKLSIKKEYFKNIVPQIRFGSSLSVGKKQDFLPITIGQFLNNQTHKNPHKDCFRYSPFNDLRWTYGEFNVSPFSFFLLSKIIKKI